MTTPEKTHQKDDVRQGYRVLGMPIVLAASSALTVLALIIAWIVVL